MSRRRARLAGAAREVLTNAANEQVALSLSATLTTGEAVEINPLF